MRGSTEKSWLSSEKAGPMLVVVVVIFVIGLSVYCAEEGSESR